MFKLIFRTISIIIITSFLIIGLAIWKGGEPFRWLGEKTVIVGKALKGVGDVVDKLIKGSEKVQEVVKEFKDIATSEKEEKK